MLRMANGLSSYRLITAIFFQIICMPSHKNAVLMVVYLELKTQ